MDWLATVLSDNTRVIIIGVIVLLILAFLYYISKKGFFSLDLKGIKIGARDKERYILRQQMNYVNSSVLEMFSSVKRTKTWDNWKSKCVAADVKDVFEMVVCFNHINLNDSYIRTVQKEVWHAIQQNSMIDPYYKGSEFKQLVYDWTKDVIVDLLQIRRENGGLDK